MSSVSLTNCSLVINDLDLIDEIISYLDFQDTLTCEKVNKLWKQVCNHEDINKGSRKQQGILFISRELTLEYRLLAEDKNSLNRSMTLWIAIMPIYKRNYENALTLEDRDECRSLIQKERNKFMLENKHKLPSLKRLWFFYHRGSVIASQYNITPPPKPGLPCPTNLELKYAAKGSCTIL